MYEFTLLSLLISVTLIHAKPDKSLSCLKGWDLAGQHCYKLYDSKVNSAEDAVENCNNIVSTGSRLPILINETIWKEVQEFVNSHSDVKTFWLGLSSDSATVQKWMWRKTVPMGFSSWKKPPSSISLPSVPDSYKGELCAMGWVDSNTKKSGWAKVKCSSDSGISTICTKRAFRTTRKVNKANKNIDVDTISKALTGIQLPNGKKIKMDINVNELKNMQAKHNLIGKLVATLLGIGDKFKGVKSPLRGDNMISAADLQKEFERMGGQLGNAGGKVGDLTGKLGGNSLTPAATDVVPKAQILDVFRPKRGAPVASNNWGSKRTITYNYDIQFVAQKEAKSAVDKAIKIWQDNTCFNFTTSDQPDVIVVSGGGCYSTVGKAKHKPPQVLSIGEGCETVAIASHEVGHLLGLAHEQARPDREKYVDVYMSNVDANYVDNFRTCCDCAEKNPYGYDFGSVMHYSASEFSSNGQPTVLPKDANHWQTIGNSHEPTFLDMKSVNDQNCQNSCKNSGTKCQNGGYPHPRNCKICICPPGFGANDCSKYAYYDGYRCGETKFVSKSAVEFTTPNFPKAMLSGYCVWMFKAKKGQYVELEFDRRIFDLPEDCLHGYVEIKDGSDFTTSGKRFCASRPPRNFTSETNVMIVITHIAETESDVHGFKARVRAVSTRTSDSATTTASTSDSKSSSKSSGSQSCASVSGSVQNASPAGLTLRADNE